MGSNSSKASKEERQINPNKEEDLIALTKDLSLNGSPLQTPRMHPVDWRSGQVFTADDDPDRMNASKIINGIRQNFYSRRILLCRGKNWLLMRLIFR